LAARLLAFGVDRLPAEQPDAHLLALALEGEEAGLPAHLEHLEDGEGRDFLEPAAERGRARRGRGEEHGAVARTRRGGLGPGHGGVHAVEGHRGLADLDAVAGAEDAFALDALAVHEGAVRAAEIAHPAATVGGSPHRCMAPRGAPRVEAELAFVAAAEHG